MADAQDTGGTDADGLADELVQAQRMDVLGHLVPGVAHDLNNPLAAIIAFSQLIRRDPRLPEDLRHDAALLVDEANRTRRLVQNLLDFARQRPPERHPTPLGALIASVLELEAYLISAAQVAVEVEVPDDVPLVPLDRMRMQQVLLNLTLNAIQAIGARGDGGHLWIRASVASEGGASHVRLEVTDDGPGISEHHRPSLFTRSFTTKAPEEGAGLGLVVAREIVAAHGGRLEYEPATGGGATFVVELPVDGPARRRPPATADAPIAPRPATPVPDANDGRPRVLVIDDEPAIRRFLSKALDIAGGEAVLAEDGPSALELLAHETFDAVWCDHRMAGMTGTEVYAAVARLHPELARRFVFMSGDVMNHDLRAFAEARGVGLLAKPFDVESVRRTLRDGLGGETAQRRG